MLSFFFWLIDGLCSGISLKCSSMGFKYFHCNINHINNGKVENHINFHDFRADKSRSLYKAICIVCVAVLIWGGGLYENTSCWE